MFRKDAGAIAEWSEENVERCIARQREILDNAAEMLAGGGKMILGSDSHTRYGALGTMAIGEGGPELVK